MEIDELTEHISSNIRVATREACLNNKHKKGKIRSVTKNRII